MGDKLIYNFSTPSAANVAARPNVINGDANFELKPMLIMMVQASPFTTRNIHFYDENLHDESETVIKNRFL